MSVPRFFVLLAVCLTTPLVVRAQSQVELTPVQQLWSSSFRAEQDKDYDRAISDVVKIMGITGDNANTYANLRLGWLYYQKKDYAQARKAYRVAAKSSPGAVSPLFGLINCDVAKKKPDGAIAAAKKLLDLDPLNLTANKTLGELYYQKQEFESAAIYYYKLSVTYPENLEMANSLAWCYLKMGDRDLAKSIFSNILAILPSHEAANLGFLKATKKTRNASAP